MVFGWGRTGKLHAEGQGNGKGLEKEQYGKWGNRGRKKGGKKRTRSSRSWNIIISKVMITENNRILIHTWSVWWVRKHESCLKRIWYIIRIQETTISEGKLWLGWSLCFIQHCLAWLIGARVVNNSSKITERSNTLCSIVVNC